MPREVQPCGTMAAYKRHLRRGEAPCEPCKDAMRENSRSRREVARRVSQASTALASLQAPQGPIDELADARENLQIVIEAMRGAPVQLLARLSKRRQELVAEVARLEALSGAKAPKDDPLQAIVRNIAERRAAQA